MHILRLFHSQKENFLKLHIHSSFSNHRKKTYQSYKYIPVIPNIERKLAKVTHIQQLFQSQKENFPKLRIYCSMHILQLSQSQKKNLAKLRICCSYSNHRKKSKEVTHIFQLFQLQKENLPKICIYCSYSNQRKKTCRSYAYIAGISII